jgi:DNA polymerase III alpha subunit
MERLHQQFIAGALATSQIDAATAQQIWELMAAFAGYGFPKAHAAGYAAVAYRMAYLKTHYPAEFMAARLAVWGGFYRPSVYMSEARRLGLMIRPPHINHSNESFTLEPPEPTSGLPPSGRPVSLWMGLGQVRELTRTTMETIIAGRPFESLEDFLTRAQPQYVEAVNLVQAGALKGLGNAHAMLAQLARERWHGRHTGQMGLLATPSPTAMPEPTLHERAEWEREVLGQSVSVHPLQLVAWPSPHLMTRSDELSQRAGQNVTLVGVRLAAHRWMTQQHELMLLVDMEDEHGMYQVLWNSAMLDRYRSELAQREPVLIRGRVRTDRQGQIIVAGHEIMLLQKLDRHEAHHDGLGRT